MEAMNKVEYKEIKSKLNELKELTKRVETNLNNMNSLITETVGQNIGVWDGDSAKEFRTSWTNIENDIPSYIQIFQNQINNIQIMLEKEKQNDTNA